MFSIPDESIIYVKCGATGYIGQRLAEPRFSNACPPVDADNAGRLQTASYVSRQLANVIENPSCQFSTLGVTHAGEVSLAHYADRLSLRDQLFSLSVLAAFVGPVELIDILITNNKKRGVFSHVRLDSCASFVSKIGGFAPWNFERAGEDDAFTNQGAIAITAPLDVRATARAGRAFAARNPLSRVKARFFDGPKQDQASGAGIMKGIMMLEANSEMPRQIA